jgi:hypothetical protein
MVIAESAIYTDTLGMRGLLVAFTAIAVNCTSGWAAEPKERAVLPPSKLTPLVKPDTVERLRPLYMLSIDSPPAGGKATKLKIEELKRDSHTSSVAYTFISGSAVGTSMTVVFALHRIALDRGAKFFVILRSHENGKPTEYLVGFSNEKVENPAKYFDVAGRFDDDLEWWSVAELGELFNQAN